MCESRSGRPVYFKQKDLPVSHLQCLLLLCCWQSRTHSAPSIMATPAWRPECDVSSQVTDAIQRGDWAEVVHLMDRGQLNERQRRWVVEQCSELCDDTGCLRHLVVTHCADEAPLEVVLRHTVTRDLWHVVGDLLQRRGSVSDEQLHWVIQQASERAEDAVLIEDLMPRWPQHQQEFALTQLVTHGKWRAVGHVLRTPGVGDKQQQKAMDEACKRASEQDLISFVLPHCHSDQLLEVAVAQLVARGLWRAVGDILKRNLSDKLNTLIVTKSLKTASHQMFREHVQPNCCFEQMDLVMTRLVSQRQWKTAGKLLRLVDDAKQTWKVGETHIDRTLLSAVVAGKWVDVSFLLQRGVRDPERRWAIHEASKRIEDTETFTGNILLHCNDVDVESILPTLAERHLWEIVGQVLGRGVSDSLRRWAIDKALKEIDDDDIFNESEFTYSMLHHCTDDELDSVLNTLVERGWWGAVGEVLQRGVSDPQCGWAMREAVTKIDVDDEGDTIAFVSYILPNCLETDLDFVLTTLVQRDWWEAVGMVLQRGAGHSQRLWALQQASERISPDDVHLLFTPKALRGCESFELESVLNTLVERGLWEAVGEILKRGVKDSQHSWAVQEAGKRADDIEFTDFILRRCADVHLVSVLPTLVERGLWGAVGDVLKQGVSVPQRNWAVHEASRRAPEWDFIHDILPHCVHKGLDSVMEQLLARRLWKAVVALLLEVVTNTLCRWAAADDITTTGPDNDQIWNLIGSPCCEMEVLFDLCESSTWPKLLKRPLEKRLHCYPLLCQVLCEAALEIIKEAWFSGRVQRPEEGCSVAEEAASFINEIHKVIEEKTHDEEQDWKSNLVAEILPLCRHNANSHRANCPFAVHFIKNLINYCYKRRERATTIEATLLILTTVPLVSEIQSVALRVMLRHKRWDVISLACLADVWEQDRRQLFQAAVEQRQWNIVTQWADHTLYDDQRWWVLGKAFAEKRWDIYLQLADHGLTETEVMSVHHRVIRYAPWDVVRQLFERGADVIEAREVLEQSTRQKNREPYTPTDRQQKTRRLVKLEKRLLKQRSVPLRNRTQLKWSTLFFELFHSVEQVDIHLALEVAKEDNAWHIVRQLAKMATDAATRDSLFPDLVRRRQWGVCRALLDRGVSAALCQAALQELMDMNQWTLVARVMELHVDEAVRRQVMQTALDRKEGSVVWQCLMNRKGDRLTEQEREDLFHTAFSREVWQAVKPLVELQDDIGLQHRDAALLAAIKRKQWDVVDHCLRNHADINMQDAEGNTPMHRAAQHSDWRTVDELTRRGGDPSLLDKGGRSVLCMAIQRRQWDTVKLLIQFHGDIHQTEHEGLISRLLMPAEPSTPLQRLISSRQGEIIELTLLWCPDQWKGVTKAGETALHAVCLSGWPDTLYYLVARGVNPLAVTKRGHSALFYAVICRECPRKMVTECIKLGFSTHQPGITDTAQGDSRLVSPVLLSVMRGLPVVTEMLYESGACSYKELFMLHIQLPEMTDYDKQPRNQPWGNDLEWEMFEIRRGLDVFGVRKRNRVRKAARFLMRVCTTPRSLKSTCRLVISHCISVHDKRRGWDIMGLPTLDTDMVNYVMFSDITDPDYGQKQEADTDDTDDDASDLADAEDLPAQLTLFLRQTRDPKEGGKEKRRRRE